MARKATEKTLWSAGQDRVALDLASGHSVRSAAKAAGVGERTVYSWLATPEYRAHVAQLRGRILDQTIGVLVAATTKAAVTLAKLLDDDGPGIRLKAAQAILASLVSLREHAELAGRLQALEDIAAAGEKGTSDEGTAQIPAKICSRAVLVRV